MHYHAEVWVPSYATASRADTECFISKVLAAHKEAYNESSDELSGFWDWWQIGGRWTGAHDPEYHPEADPRNHETCIHCNGTGFRRDSIGETARAVDSTYTCNACGVKEKNGWTHGRFGPGVLVKWSTEWVPYDGDIKPITKISDDLTCYTLIVRNQVFHQERWTGETVEKTDFDGRVLPKLRELGVADGCLVTVDYHS